MIATSIKQSQHLLRLGLDPSTADMHWFDIDGYNPHKNDWRLMCGHCDVADCSKGIYVPAWSLSALLEVMPKEIKKDDKQYNFHLETTHNLYYVSYYRYDIDGIRYLHTTEMNNCTIDAAYEMVCWLLEQGIIEKV